MKNIFYFIIVFFLFLVVYGMYETDKNFNRLYKPAIEKIKQEIRDALE
jgi:type IV secretory pathway VirB3-like protein